jgi:nucleoid-associated protein YgaU
MREIKTAKSISRESTLVVPPEWMPDASMKRIICHWTGGAYKASVLDRMHYHILIEDNGDLVRGCCSIKDNESARDGRYAAHTLRCNTGSIGVAVCCMAGASELPFQEGPFPMTEVQWERMADIVAELCDRYDIAVTDQTVIGHGEVQCNLGIAQRGKWDPLVLPWKPRASRERVGSLFRIKVLAALEEIRQTRRMHKPAPPDDEPAAVPFVAFMNDVALPNAVLYNEGAYVPIASLGLVGWKIVTVSSSHVVLQGQQGREHRLPYYFLNAEELGIAANDTEIRRRVERDGLVSAIDIARSGLLPVTYDPNTNTVVIGSGAPPTASRQPASTTLPVTITVRPGDTLYAIAERYLGNGNRWTSLMKKDGSFFTQADAKRLDVGQEILLPETPRSQRVDLPTDPDEAPTVDGLPPELLPELIRAARPELKTFAGRSVPLIMMECMAEGIRDAGQIAYILATSDHESNCGRFMRELGNRSYFERYEFRTTLGNKAAGDGFRYRGRGFVQLTGRANYGRWSEELGIDLLGDPDIVATDPRIAAKILVRGMAKGLFRRRRLGDFIVGEKRDFWNARDVINGDKAKNGTRIAGYANRYLAALTPRWTTLLSAELRPIPSAVPRFTEPATIPAPA